MASEAIWHLANIWENVAEAVPDSLAVVFEDQRLTWCEYEREADKLAQVFVDHGLKPGSKVAIYAYNSIECFVAQFAAFKARLCPININYRYLETELARLINNSDGEATVCQTEFASRLESIRYEMGLTTSSNNGRNLCNAG